MNEELLKEWDYNLNELSPYVTSGTTKAWWICLKDERHESYQRALNTKPIGKGCQICAGKRVKTGVNDLKSLNPDIAEEYSTFNEVRLEEIGYGSGQKRIWNCKLNHYWEATPRTRTNNHHCPYCSGNKILEGFNDFKSKFPLLYEEIDGNKNDMEMVNKIIGSSGKRVWWICPEGHSYEAKILNRINGSGCPYCSGNKVLKGYNDFSSHYPHQLLEWDWKNNGKSPYEYSYGSNQIVYWNCFKGHSWQTTVKKKMYGAVCNICNKSFSNFEKIVKDYIEIIYDGEIRERQRILKDTNSRGKLELDLVLPDIKIAIEIQDFATHDKYSDNIKTPYKNLNLTKRGPIYHNIKKELAFEQFDYKVIEIWEDEIINGEYRKIIDDFI